MPTWIVTHSKFLCNFLTPLLVGFTPAQLRHALNVSEALLVCTARHKTLAELTRWLWVEHADEYALADFFRQSKWTPKKISTDFDESASYNVEITRKHYRFFAVDRSNIDGRFVIKL